MLPARDRRRMLVGLLSLLSGVVVTAQCCLALMELNDSHHQRHLHSLARLHCSERSTYLIRRRGMQRNQRKHWVKPGRTSAWWDNFVDGIVVPEE